MSICRAPLSCWTFVPRRTRGIAHHATKNQNERPLPLDESRKLRRLGNRVINATAHGDQWPGWQHKPDRGFGEEKRLKKAVRGAAISANDSLQPTIDAAALDPGEPLTYVQSADDITVGHLVELVRYVLSHLSLSYELHNFSCTVEVFLSYASYWEHPREGQSSFCPPMARVDHTSALMPHSPIRTLSTVRSLPKPGIWSFQRMTSK